MLNPRAKTGQNNPSKVIPDFWELLCLVWDEDRIDKWKRTIFPDYQHPDIGLERCFNLISLSPDTHDMWNSVVFALKPLKLSSDVRSLLFNSSGKFLAITTLKAGFIYSQNPQHQKAWISSHTGIG